MSGARRPSGSVSTSSSPIRISRPIGTAASSTAQVAGPDAVMQARGADEDAVERGVDVAGHRDRLVAVLRARLDEHPPHLNAAGGEHLGVACRPHAGLDSDPARGRPASARSRQPSSHRFSEIRSGSSVHSEIRRARASTSPPVIQSPVEKEISTPGAASRSAAHRGGDVGRARATRARPGRADGRAATPRPRRRTRARRPRAPTASAGRPPRGPRSGRPGGPCHRGGDGGEQQRADQERPARPQPRDQHQRRGEVADEAAGRAERVQPPGDVAGRRRPTACAAGSPTATARRAPAPAGRRARPATSREPENSPSASSVTSNSGIASSGISATRPAPISAVSARPRACGCRSASRPPSQ